MDFKLDLGYQAQPMVSYSPSSQTMDELRQARREIELLKTMDPFHAAEMALEIQMERLHVAEAMSARDTVVHRLVDAYTSLRQKNAIIERCKQEHSTRRLREENIRTTHKDSSNCDGSEDTQLLSPTADPMSDAILNNLENSLKSLCVDYNASRNRATDPPPDYDLIGSQRQDEPQAAAIHPGHAASRPLLLPCTGSVPSLSDPSLTPQSVSSSSINTSPGIPSAHSDYFHAKISQSPVNSNDVESSILARYAILAELALPPNTPEDALNPIIIPATITFHEFLASASGSLSNSLSNYRVFHQLTTFWCPEREEHGYMLSPLFRCSTNPRAATAHRWSMIDVIDKMNKPTECFYNRDGKWYYAGIYQAFRLDDLTTMEWGSLPPETAQLLVKETLSGRKNVSPQNHYETSQLYACGALKIACVGLQCVGFNHAMYSAVQDHADKYTLSAKWKTTSAAGGALLSPVSDWSLPGKTV